jgi:hypothetical protein
MILKFLIDFIKTTFSSFRDRRHLLVPVYLSVLLVLLLLSYTSWLKFGEPLYFYGDIAGGDGEQRFGAGAATVGGSMFLVVAGVFFLFVTRLFFLMQAKPLITQSRWWWFVAGVGAIFLGLDEILMIHEYLTWKMQDIGVPKPLGIDQDIFVFAAYGIVAVILAIKLWPSIYHYKRVIFPLVATFIFMAATEVVDMIPWESLSLDQKMILGSFEEILKTMGEWSLFLYAGMLVEEIITSHTSEHFQRN